MAKRKIKKQSFICIVLFAVMCVLAVLNFALPQFKRTIEGNVGSIGSSSSREYNMFDLLDGMSDKDISDKTDGGKAASAAFFSDDDKTQAKWFAVLTLITTIVACLGIVMAVLALVVPKIGGYIKYLGALLALLAIVTFIFGIVVTKEFSSSSNIGGIASGSITVQLAVGAILSFIGGLGAVVVPLVFKK